MKPTLFRSVLALALLALPAVATAQPAGPPRGAPPREVVHDRHGGRAFAMLLRERERLALTDEQVRRLDTIRRRLEARNAPLREKLRREHARFVAQRREQLSRLTPDERRDTLRALREQRRRGDGPGLPPAMRPLAVEMRGNIRAAMEEAQGVLTDEQKQRARELLRERRRETRREIRRERRERRADPLPPRGR